MSRSVIDNTEKAGSRFRDKYDPKVADWIQAYGGGGTNGTSQTGHTAHTDHMGHAGHAGHADEGPAEFDAALLGAPLSKTSISHSAAFQLPDAIRKSFQAFTPYSVHHRLNLADRLRVVDIGNVQMHKTDLGLCQQNIEAAAKSYWQQHRKPLVLLGGDHSITGASILGMTEATGLSCGIVHFDAHHDVRNLEDGGRTNGTPFRTLLESEAIDGHKLVQIGLRDFTNAQAYHEYVLHHGATVYTARDVRKQGLLELVQQSFDIASKGTDAVYVSFDMDVLDQSFVPGVPAPSPGGLDIWETIETLEWLGQQSNVEAMDVVCADPNQDFRDLTTRVASTLVLSFLTGLALRQP
ncbi:agmatinase family protein [Alicyclobacillus sp. SO9]|uniref:agmatinase family protein n=1 Tax=Alicyclobacillus sp. SO9 TaxID=2665646 RepID=UPI0018E81F84|nr:agmatinase family protein [Alicyclobacillus sp. SO9]QQE79277.1 agmatinase family protein [Alicyclobacillus sp. SO9]